MINNLKALVKDLGYEWNGKSLSMLQFINSLKTYLNPEGRANYVDTEGDDHAPARTFSKLVSADSTKILTLKQSDGSYSVIELIKDAFYNSGQTMY